MIEQIKNEIVSYVKMNPGTSYIEIENIFTKFGFAWKGDYDICGGVDGNVVYWSGWNPEAIGVVADLKSNGFIRPFTTPPLVYLIDGGGLTLPLATFGKEYKKPHWLPTAFDFVG